MTREPVRSYRDLIVWQRSMDLAMAVYEATKPFPREEIYGLTSQMRRASVSVISNIAEGQGRSTRGELLQFLGNARGSLAELGAQTTLAARLGYLPRPNEQALDMLLSEVGRLLNALRKSLRNRAASKPDQTQSPPH